MGKRKSPDKSPNREKKWDKIFNALVKMSQNLQKDRQFLERQIKFLYEVICKMKLEQKFDSLKAELLLGLKEREAVVFKQRYVNTKDDLADFKEWFDYLLQKCSWPTDISIDVSNKCEGPRNKALQAEIWKLKSEIEKYKLEKNSEVSALIAEKNFVWNQFNKMESNFSEQLKKKCYEVECANQKVQTLVMSNEMLRADFTKLESESVQKSEEISKLLKEIELLKSRSGSAHFSLRPCRKEAAASSREGKNSAAKGSITTVKKESDPSQTTEKLEVDLAIELEKTTRTRLSAHKSSGGKAPRKQFTSKGSSSSKRKEVDAITTPDTPRLFSSSFKIPKLKTSSSPQIV